MVKAPEKLWMTAEEMGWPGSFRSFRMSDLEHPEDEYPAYVRADLYSKAIDEYAKLAAAAAKELEQVKRNNIGLHDEVQFMRNAAKENREAAERLAGARVKPLRELIASYSTRFTDEKVDYQRGILDTLDNIEMVLDGTHDEGPPLAEPAGEAEHIETYYTKGKDAEYFEKLTDKDFAWEITKAAQDLNDSGDNVADWMPVSAMLSDAADRLNKHLATPPASAIREAAETARACLAGLVSAGHNCPSPDPDQIEKAFWALDAALAGSAE